MFNVALGRQGRAQPKAKKSERPLFADQSSSVAGMVRAGPGVKVVPALTLFRFEHQDLVSRPVRAKGLTREVFLVRRSDRGLSIAAPALCDPLMKHRPGRA